MDPNAGRPARQYQWSLGFQREITPNFVLDLTYVGNRGIWWQAPALLNFNANTPERLKSFGLDINSPADRTLLLSRMDSPAVAARGFRSPYAGFPTGQLLAQALRPFPQFAGTPGPFNPSPISIPVYWNPMGNTWYDALQIKATQRLSHGLTLLSTFSWSKSLSLGTEIGEPNPGSTGGAVFNNIFDRNSNKYISRYDQPFYFNVSLNYETPKIAAHRVLSSVLSNWTLGAYLQRSSGFPLQVPNGQTSLESYLFQGPGPATVYSGSQLPLLRSKQDVRAE
jgi:hypothetical protein